MRLSSPARLIVSLYRQHKDPATGWHREVYSRARCGLMPVYGLAPPARAGAPRYRDWRGRRAGGARAPNMPKRPARRSEAPSEAERGIGGADSGTIRTISPPAHRLLPPAASGQPSPLAPGTCNDRGQRPADCGRMPVEQGGYARPQRRGGQSPPGRARWIAAVTRPYRGEHQMAAPGERASRAGTGGTGRRLHHQCPLTGAPARWDPLDRPHWRPEVLN